MFKLEKSGEVEPQNMLKLKNTNCWMHIL